MWRSSLFLSFAAVLVVRSRAQGAYEPPCDTTRAERDAIRAAVIAAAGGTFSTHYEAVVSKLGQDADPQGESLAYNFRNTSVTACSEERPQLCGQFNMPTPQDAILYLFCLPPPGTWDYIGGTDYAVMFDASQDGWQNPINRVPNAEIGDSWNQLNLGTTAPPGASPFGHTAAVIHTPDQESAVSLIQALEEAGFPRSAVKVQVIPSLDPFEGRITFGQEFENTVFVGGLRVRSFRDEEAAALYANYQEPVLYFTDSNRPRAPMAFPGFKPRGSTVTEAYLLQGQQRLKRQVIQKMRAKDYILVNERMIEPSPIMDPFNCYDRFDQQPRGTCFQGSQDICYGILGGTRPQQNQLTVVVGAIHSLSGLATYSSVGYNVPGENGSPPYSFNSRQLQGSAYEYLDGSDLEAELLFVLTIHPQDVSCNSCSNCEACLNSDAPDFCVCHPSRDAPTLVSRATLDPNTMTGPNFDDLAVPIVLTFELQSCIGCHRGHCNGNRCMYDACEQEHPGDPWTCLVKRDRLGGDLDASCGEVLGEWRCQECAYKGFELDKYCCHLCEEISSLPTPFIVW